MQSEPQLLSHEPSGDAVGVVAVLLLGIVFAAGVGIGRLSMARPGRGRDRKAREKAAQPPKRLSERGERILAICREAVRAIFDRDFDELPREWQVKIETAALDAENAGPEVQRLAAVAEYRYQTRRERYARQSEGDDDAP